MADYTAYPSGPDIILLMKSAGYWPTQAADSAAVLIPTEQASIMAAGSAATFESRTGWDPFLSSGVSETRYFDNTDWAGQLALGSGLLSVSSVIVDGAVQVQDTNYWLRNAGRASSKAPYDLLTFQSGLRRLSNIPNRIAVTGVWGVYTTLPADVWSAIQQNAGALLLASIINQQSMAATSQDGFSKSLDIVGILTQKDQAQLWAKDFDKACSRYTRVVI
jgi:hypothetical protein